MQWLLAGSVAVHLMLLAGLFTTHFTSPIVQGIDAGHAADLPPALADRVVFIVADGARVDKVAAPLPGEVACFCCDQRSCRCLRQVQCRTYSS